MTLPAHLPRYPAPAKLNLDLRIIGRLANGYHALESIFTLINLHDTLCISPRDDGQIILHTPTANVPTEQDLTVRAARCLQQYTSSTQGADIWLEKQIPMGGGLGGGSSDAATVLWVLNHLWQTQCSSAQLQTLGLSLGADVPFFLFGQTAFARGIGEQLEPFAMPQQYYVLVRPDVAVATPKVFAHPDLPRNSPSSLHPCFETLQPFRNDMQQVVLKEYPEVQAAFEQLQRFGEPRMTGSGSCLFLTTDTLATAQNIQQQLPPTLTSWCVASTKQHPLFSILSSN